MKIFIFIILTCISISQATVLPSRDETRHPRVKRQGLGTNVTIGDSEYFISNYLAEVSSVARYCNDIGMSLVSLESEEKNQLIRDFLSSDDWNFTYWTSGRRQVEGYVWTSSGQPVTFTDWMAGEPNVEEARESCIEVNGRTGWSDHYCEYINFFMCEKRQELYM